MSDLNLFSVFEIDGTSAQEVEPMGTKSKFWLDHEQLGRCLFKTTRPGTGEDWAEKISAELANLIGLPHARYELAKFEGERGVLSLSFAPKGTELVPGNEFMVETDPGYPKKANRTQYRTPEHVLGRVLDTLSSKNILPPAEWRTTAEMVSAADVFVGYLLFDAWIGNGDRHDENWGILLRRSAGEATQFDRYLAPTFDHASSLGRNESDDRRLLRIESNDANFSVSGYAFRSRSAFYAAATDNHPMSTFDAFSSAAKSIETAAAYWLKQLGNVSDAEVRAILSRIPEEFMSQTASRFAQKMLEFNQQRLLALRSVFE
ncbi:MAG: HipA-like protein [Cyanobacteria bacterium DS2.3.42]|nr:HipA-like protein [Cyanobacteria bacterium DS2.3.42]